jgi:hypothetical protein
MPTTVEQKETLLKLNSYLEAIAAVNSFTNDGKTYCIELLDKINNNVQDTLRNHFDVKLWTITTTPVEENWKDVFNKELHGYFFQYVGEMIVQSDRQKYDALRDTDPKTFIEVITGTMKSLHLEYILSGFVDRLEEIIPQNSVLKEWKLNGSNMRNRGTSVTKTIIYLKLIPNYCFCISADRIDQEALYATNARL